MGDGIGEHYRLHNLNSLKRGCLGFRVCCLNSIKRAYVGFKLEGLGSKLLNWGYTWGYACFRV